MRPRFTRRMVIALAAVTIPCPLGSAAPTTTVVFVCEHGVAKSLIAAEVFNRMARARGSAAVGVSRGVTPEARVPDGVREGLAREGIDVSGFVPRRLGADDVRGATRIVLIGAQADLAGRSAGVERWDDVSAVSENYARAHADIVAHVDDLLTRMGR
ncbi:MAG: hypothetical protein KJS97_03175 [Alphaproteobacteria bacterium]|nr:hypothetical protein [Alphaproteobacteria bacterium]